MNKLYHLIRADFLERTRRYSFLVTLGLVLYLGYAVNAGQILLRLDRYRGVLNSAWVGSLTALTVNFFLGWFGLYLIKNAIARDYDTGVGQIMATTPLSRPLYTLGKWLSNFAVLLVMLVILALAGIVMQLIAREVPQFDLWALLAPMLFVALPMMALVAALAVLFETIAWLRGGLGNVVYFFVFPVLLITTMTLGEQVPALDVVGMQTFTASMRRVLISVDPTYAGGATFGIVPAGALKTFVWPGLAWSGAMIWPRLLIVGAAAGLGAALRLVLAGQWAALLAWVTAVVFIPSLALALGTWTNSNKAFEVIYLVLWYGGPLNGLAALDFIGARDEALGRHLPLVYLAAAVVLLVLAVLGRRRQITV